ncbi:hypothetical protein [Pseudoalteromonas aurantia]|nr:hypothetical protein [Pseudoalteromonas aurantia]
MFNSATAYTNPETTAPTKTPFNWMAFFNRIGKLYALSAVSRYK